VHARSPIQTPPNSGGEWAEFIVSTVRRIQQYLGNIGSGLN